MIEDNQYNNKYKILLVDDIPSNLNFLSDILHEEGFSIRIATSGKDALVSAHSEKPDLLLLDIAMPDFDGYMVSEALKKDPSTNDIPIIFITARTEQEDIIKGFEVGAVDYILKPFNHVELIARVKTQLDLRNKTQQLKTINLHLEEIVRQRTAELQNSNKNLTELNTKLTLAYDELSNLNKVKNEFIRHINHELRTPLQGIHGYSMILEDLMQSPEQKEYLHAINGLVDKLVHLSEISLLFTEIRSDNYKLELEGIELNQYLPELCKHVAAQQLSIVFDMPDKPVYIRADQRLLTTCLNLILENAVKFSPVHGQIRISVCQADNKAILDIKDQGPGFSENALENLFVLFSADNLQYKTQGFGIGLATAKLILNALSADMQISNLHGAGACVQLSFPVYS